MKKQTCFVLLLQTILGYAHAQSCSTDSLQLVQLYNNLNGPAWYNPWNLQQPLSTWHGITLNPGGCVSELNIAGKLRGSVPNLQLPELLSLSLHNADLPDSTGITSLPDFSGLPKLESISLQFLVKAPAGTAMPNFSHCPNLIAFESIWNLYTGPMTNFSHFPKLRQLTIGSSFATGDIPDYNAIPDLTALIIYEPNAKLVPDFSHTPQLEYLDLTGNHLGEGQTFPDFSHAPKLKHLALDGSKEIGAVYASEFSGPIPDFAHVPALESLSLQYAKASAEIPDFSHVPKLKNLVVTGVNLFGSIPDFQHLPDLENLNIGGWLDYSLFIPQFPYPSKIKGPVPDFTNLPLLKYLNLSLNRLSGNLPNFSHFDSIQTIDLSNNLLCRTIPSFEHLPNTATTIDLNNNHFDRIDPLQTTAALQVLQNYLTLEDLMPQLNKLSAYNDQDSIPVSPLFNGMQDIDLQVDANTDQTTFQWFKNNVIVAVTSVNHWTDPTPILPSDRYFVQWFHNQIHDLLLKSRVFNSTGLQDSAHFTVSNTSGCAPLSVYFQNTGSGSENAPAQWTFEGGTPATSSLGSLFVSFSEPGNHLVTLQTGDDCNPKSVQQNVFLQITPKPSAAFTYVVSGNTVTFTADPANTTSYTWNFGDAGLGNGNPVTHTYAGFSNFQVTLTAIGPCGFNSTQQTVGIVKVSDSANVETWQVLPNPSNGRFTLAGALADPLPDRISVALYDLTGRVLYRAEVAPDAQQKVQLDVRDLPSGAYLLRVQTGERSGVRRVLIVR